MTDNVKDILLDDPLSTETRSKRRVLLGVSLMGIAMAKAGLIPKKINALGVELESGNQGALLYLVAAVIIYFFVAFLIYGASDFIAWRKRISIFYAENTKSFFKRMTEGERDRNSYESIIKDAEERVQFWGRLSPTSSTIRAAFEFIPPLLFSAYAIFNLIELAIRKA